MPNNHASWLIDNKGKNLEVRDAPYKSPGPDQVVVKPGAVAINPVDYVKQLSGDMLFPWIKYPFILGFDLAGEVVEVGKGVTDIKPGDRVLCAAAGMDKRSADPAESAFQEYVIVRQWLLTPIPDELSYTQACVVPLGFFIATCALFEKGYLELPRPVPGKPVALRNETLLVWGGSTSVGVNAIQLAVAAGYEVVATSSPKNFEALKRLGAAATFDYKSASVVKDITAWLTARGPCAGAVAAGDGSTELCVDIIGAVPGPPKGSPSRGKFVSQLSLPLDPITMPKGLGMVRVMLGFIWWNFSIMVKSRMRGVKYKFVEANDPSVEDLIKYMFREFLPTALHEGFVTSPEPLVVGKGLEYIQPALELHRKGVSMRKVVVEL